MGKIERYFFKVVALISFVICLFGAWKQNSYLVWSGGIGALVLLILAYFERFKEIDMFGFKAKMTEANEVIDRGQDVVKELRLLSKYVANVTLSLVQRVGRSGWYSLAERETMKDSIIEILRRIGLTEKEEEELLRDWHWFIKHQYADLILKNTIHDGLSLEQIKKQEKFTNWGWCADPDELEKYLEEIDSLSEQKRELIEDYRYYIRLGIHRRPEVWKTLSAH